MAVASADVLQTVTALVAEVLDLQPDSVTADRPLLELGAQSFDFVELTIRLDRQYGISLPRSLAIPDRHTVASYVTAIEAHTQTRNDR